MRAASAGRRSRDGLHAAPSRPSTALHTTDDIANRYNANMSPKSENTFGSDVLEAKITRKRAESDLQLLANRIALLKLEEHKALSKVHETKSRAKEILEVKQRNQDLLEIRMKRNRIREQQLHAIQMKASAEREERRAKISETQKLVFESRKAVAQQGKEETKRVNEIANTTKALSEAEKRRKAEDEKRR